MRISTKKCQNWRSTSTPLNKKNIMIFKHIPCELLRTWLYLTGKNIFAFSSFPKFGPLRNLRSKNDAANPVAVTALTQSGFVVQFKQKSTALLLLCLRNLLIKWVRFMSWLKTATRSDFALYRVRTGSCAGHFVCCSVISISVLFFFN